MNLFTNKSVKQKSIADAHKRQLEVLSAEIALAGGESLKKIFNFTDEMVAIWLDTTLNQATINRENEEKNRLKYRLSNNE